MNIDDRDRRFRVGLLFRECELATARHPNAKRVEGKFNRHFLAWVTAAMKSGKTADAAAAEYPIPATYKGYTPNADQTKSNVAVIYKELAK